MEMKVVSKRAREIPPFIVMEVLEKAHELERQGRNIIHLEVGEPDFPTPRCICEAAQEAMEKGETHYTHSLGIFELREAICEHYREKYGVHVDPGQIIVTSGTSPALFMIFSTLLEVGDEIIMSDPHYPCYPNYANFMGAKPAFVNVHEEDGFQLRPEEIKKKIGPGTRAILINSPPNPSSLTLRIMYLRRSSYVVFIRSTSSWAFVRAARPAHWEMLPADMKKFCCTFCKGRTNSGGAMT